MKKFYLLVEFPYPSAAGLHVGNARSWCSMDAYARKKRMEGYDVLFPFGWDAFGLPAENYAIKMGIHPTVTTAQNIATYKRQAKDLNLSFDWEHEINTSDPKYYKWTQWIFVQLFKKDLAYQAKVPVNWCPKCKTNLADEEVLENGTHERCGTLVEKRLQKQWLLRITKYADRLINDLKKVDFSPAIARQQVNWIGRSEGYEIKFDDITVFTTRPETITGATFIAVAPDSKWVKHAGQEVLNPATGEKIPVFKADYVLSDYGTGAIMGVPAHDERDMIFAKANKLPIIDLPAGRQVLPSDMEKYGKKVVRYHLRDWIFSRQHYWGEPIPIIHCPKCGAVAVPEADLPVELPYVEKYEPSGTGESPLATMTDWVNTKCPKCGGPAKRETDTMPNWAGSNWYFIRYLDPDYDQGLARKELMAKWLPVDLYQGGFEHTTLHLLYSRFIYKFLFDIGVVPTDEPYLRRRSHGIVLGSDGRKMSKSFGNVINPDEIVNKYGADTLRLYEMFMGPFGQMVAWSEESLEGCYRWLGRVRNLYKDRIGTKTSEKLSIKLHQTIKKVSEDLDNLKFNTAVAILMELTNLWNDEGQMTKEDADKLAQIIYPLAPQLAEEVYPGVGKMPWPTYDKAKIANLETEIVVQVNGKFRGKAKTEAEAKKIASKWLEGKKIENIIKVEGKLINFVI